MTDTRKNERRPGEKRPGKFHYNPGNQSGKTVEICKEEADRKANTDKERKEDRKP